MARKRKGKKSLNRNEVLHGCHVESIRPSELRSNTDQEHQEMIQRLSEDSENLSAMERDRRNSARIGKVTEDCPSPMETAVEAQPEGFGPCISTFVSDSEEILESKMKDAFSKELKLLICEQYKNAMEKRVPEVKRETRRSPRLNSSSKELPSESYSREDKMPFLSNQQVDVFSSSISHADKKLSRRLFNRRKAHQHEDSMYPKVEEKKARHAASLDTTRSSVKGREITDKGKFMFYYPSRDDPGCVELYYSNLECLGPRMYLSSPIMNYYIQYLQKSLSPTDKRIDDCYIFNTFFYNKLEKAITCKDDKSTSFPTLRRWWKGMDIFRKAYILLPICTELHWSLVIICIPGKEDQTGLMVLHLDSLGLHSSSHIFSIISSYLEEEWICIKENALNKDLPFSEKIWENLPSMIEKEIIAVPQQQNSYDCGLFVLYFIKQFLLEAPERMRKTDLTMFGRNWFEPEKASGLRQIIKDVLVEEFKSRFDSIAEETDGASQDE